MSQYYIAIMAGGVGSRFWPSSTEERPKQFLDILDSGKSLIRITFERCAELVGSSNILILTNEKYRELISEHLPELDANNILCEPSRNNTAPSIAYAALHIQAKNPEAVFAVLPADHIIEKESVYLNKLTNAFAYALENDAIVTLGIKPSRPDTGYGYIKIGEEQEDDVFKVSSFKEKPNELRAIEYVESGRYLWNAGMFVWKVQTILNAFRKYEPEILKQLERSKEKFGTNEEQAYINEVYPATKSISVDYAILEKAENVYTIPADIDWSDLGTWNSLHAYLDKDEHQNVIQAQKVHLDKVSNSLIIAKNERMVVIKGLDNYIVVDEDEALLIYPKDQEQEIKQVVENLKKK